MQIKCPYCGNTSGKRDSRGGCISCGGNFSDNQVLVGNSMLPYTGITGSNYYWSQWKDGTGSSYSCGSIYDLPEIIMETLRHPSYGCTTESAIDMVYGVPSHIYLEWRNAGGVGIVPDWFIRKFNGE